MKDLILALEMVQYLKVAHDTLNKIEYIDEEDVEDISLALDVFKCNLFKKRRGRE